jgi:hypothetical protein
MDGLRRPAFHPTSDPRGTSAANRLRDLARWKYGRIGACHLNGRHPPRHGAF